jgi:hypothetical protein
VRRSLSAAAGLWLLVALPSAVRAQNAQHRAAFGEIGVARVSARNGVVLSLGHELSWQRFALSANVELLILAFSLGCNPMGVSNGRFVCRDPNSPTVVVVDPNGTGLLNQNRQYSRAAGTIGSVIDATMAPWAGVPVAAGVGYRVGQGWGTVGVVTAAKTIRTSGELIGRVHVGAHYAAVRLGARLFY